MLYLHFNKTAKHNTNITCRTPLWTKSNSVFFCCNVSLKRCHPSLASNVPHSKHCPNRLTLTFSLYTSSAHFLLIVQHFKWVHLLQQCSPTVGKSFCKSTGGEDFIHTATRSYFGTHWIIKGIFSWNFFQQLTSLRLQRDLCVQNNLVMLHWTQEVPKKGIKKYCIEQNNCCKKNKNKQNKTWWFLRFWMWSTFFTWD